MSKNCINGPVPPFDWLSRTRGPFKSRINARTKIRRVSLFSTEGVRRFELSNNAAIRLFRIAAALLLPLFLGSCNQPTQNAGKEDSVDTDHQRNGDSTYVDDIPESEKGGNRTVVISLAISGDEDGSPDSAAPARTIRPDFSTVDSFAVACVHEDGEEILPQPLEPGSSLELSLKNGNWTISAEGYLPGQEETASLRGSASVTVPAGPKEEPLLVSISLTPVEEGEQGFFRYQISYPEDKARSGALRLSRIGEEGEAEIYKTVDPLEEPQGLISADPGVYFMEIELFGRYSRAAAFEEIRIYPFMETKAPEYRFTEEDFPDILIFSDAAAMKAHLDLLEENSEDNPYPVKFINGNLSSKEGADADLKTIIGAASRFIDLDLRECEGEQYLSLSPANREDRKRIVSLRLPETIRTIDPNGFLGYDALTSLDAPGVETIGQGAFRDCEKLTSLDFPNLTVIGEAKNSGVGTFRNCANLASFAAPKLRHAGDYAFYNCDALVTVQFPALKSLGRSAFGDCGNLQTLAIPQVEFIGGGAFSKCVSLEVLALGPIPPALDSNRVFASGKPLEILIPDEAVEIYRNTEKENWTAALKAKVRGLSQTEE